MKLTVATVLISLLFFACENDSSSKSATFKTVVFESQQLIASNGGLIEEGQFKLESGEGIEGCVMQTPPTFSPYLESNLNVKLLVSGVDTSVNSESQIFEVRTYRVSNDFVTVLESHKIGIDDVDTLTKNGDQLVSIDQPLALLGSGDVMVKVCNVTDNLSLNIERVVLDFTRL